VYVNAKPPSVPNKLLVTLFFWKPSNLGNIGIVIA
jgi:hypothetical protein